MQNGNAVRRCGTAMWAGIWCSIQHHSLALLGAPQAKNLFKFFSLRHCGTALRHGRWCSIKHHSPPLIGAPQAKNIFKFLFGTAVRRCGGAAVRYDRWCSIQHHSSPWLGAPLAKIFLKVFSLQDCGTAVRYGGCGKALRYGVAVRRCGTVLRQGR